MKSVSSMWLLCVAAAVASAIRVPPSWQEEQNYESYKSKLRKTRQKPSQKPVLERRVGGFSQANHRYRTKIPNRSKGESVIQSRIGVQANPMILSLGSKIDNEPIYQGAYENVPNSRLVQSNEQNYWIPTDTPNIQYSGAIRNTVISKEYPKYQRWPENKDKIRSKNNRYKTISQSAKDDLIRQLEKHQILQKNLAALDRSPGKLRGIYLKDQLKRKAINNFNHQPGLNSSGIKIDASEISFTTIKPELLFTQTPKKKFQNAQKHRRPKSAKHDKGEMEKIQKVILTNYREDELHEPHKDTNERDDTLHEPKNDEDSEKLDDNIEKEEMEINDKEDNSENDSEIIVDKEQESEQESADTEEEDAKSEEENEESNEEPVRSEHANPKNIQTKPVYPGEGQWARPGRKHRPYASQHRFISPDDPQENKPDGYDVFEDLSRYFDDQRATFERQGKFSPGDNLPINRVPTFGEQLQVELPTPPPNTWRPNNPNAVQPVNPIIVYDPFNEPSETLKTTLSTNFNPTAQPASPEVKKIDGVKVQVSKTNKHEELRNNEDIQEKTHTPHEKPDTEENDVDFENETSEEIEKTDQEDEDLEIDPESDEEDDDDDFTPMQLYTQVRHSANVEHLPSDPEESGRLKEVIKDSKIQTVYTEEGYEDLAYDHAGHEKKAESDEGFAQFEKDKEEQGNKEKDSSTRESRKQEILDSVPLNTNFEKKGEHIILEPLTKKQNSNNFLSTQQVKTTELKDKGNGKLQMEIQNEIKTVMQPNNSDTAQSSLTIYPKIYQDLGKLVVIEEDIFHTQTTTESPSIREQNNTDHNITELTRNLMFNETTTNFTTTTAYGMDKMEMPDPTVDSNPDSTNSTHVLNFGENPYSPKEQTTMIPALQLDNNDYNEESSYTENYITEGYFDPETDNFDVKDIPVKSVADIFSNKKNGNFPEPEIFSKELKEGTTPLDNIDDQFEKSFKKLIRQKRGSGFLNVNVDTDFIDHIDHSLSSKPPSYDSLKYPYYKDLTIAENSPLHYAENLQNIPEKVKGKLSFYEKAEEMQCPDLDEPNPIPDNIENKGNNDNEDEQNHKKAGAPKKSRLELASKIKCYKKRYFGDSPLDSPFFKEEFVGPVKPIFKELIKKTASLSKDSEIRGSTVMKTVDEANTIFNKLDNDIKQKYQRENNQKEFDVTVESRQQSSIVEPNSMYPEPQAKNSQENSNTKSKKTTLGSATYKGPEANTKKPQETDSSTLLPLPTLITTPQYTLRLTPKNIYDQITLLDHLDTSGTEFLPPANSVLDNVPIKANRRESKSIKLNDKENTSTIEPQALRRRRKPQNIRPNYHVVLNRRSSTTTPFPFIDTKPTTVLPKYKVISEVFYKDEIQPNEQLAVFSDILNNIRNASKLEAQVQMQSTSNFAEPSAVTISSINTYTKRAQRKKQPTRTKKYQGYLSAINKPSTPKHKISTSPPSYINVLKELENKTSKYSSQIRQTLSNQLVHRGKVPGATTTTTGRPAKQSNKMPLRKNFPPILIDFVKESTEIVGLVPPDNDNYNTIVLDNIIDKEDVVTSLPLQLPKKHLYEYKTIILPTSTEQLPAPVSEVIKEPIVIQLNKYLFLGLKPPKPQKVRPYTDFILGSSISKRQDIIKYKRYRREAQRPAYSELSRNRGRQEEILEKPDVIADDSDDYIPHRPQNYYYDEKTGKIVYSSKSKPQIEEEEEEIIEYEEITESKPPSDSTTTKIKTKLLLATAKPPPPGESFIDFLNKVRNDPNYKLIPDPTTTEKGSVPELTELTTRRPLVSTNPPEFLNILAKVKSDSLYKPIEDPDNKTKKKFSTTTEANLEEESDEEEEEEDDKKHVTDVSEFIPDGINYYAPRTRIDYSKYKTINRGSAKQRPNVENPDEKIDYTAIVRSRKPVYDDDEPIFPSITTVRAQLELRTRRPAVKENEKSDVSESRYYDLLSSLESTTSEYKPSGYISQHRKRPVKSSTTTPIPEEQSERNLEIIAPPIQNRRGSRLTTTTSPTTPVLEIQEQSTRLPTKKRRPTTPRGFQSSVELVRTTEAVVRVYPENHRPKRVYRRQPVHINTHPTREKDLEDAENIPKLLRRRSESLSDVGQTSFLDPIYIEDGVDESVDRDDRSIDQSESTQNQYPPKSKHKDVEIINEYNKNNKHGGNYKKEYKDNLEEIPAESEKEDNIYVLLRGKEKNVKQKDDKLVMKLNFDQLAVSQKEEVEFITKIINNENKTGGNYKPENKNVNTKLLGTEKNKAAYNSDLNPENQEDTSLFFPKSKRLTSFKNITSNVLINREPIRLSDVVPKPDHFYSDPGLPKQINQLRDYKSLPKVGSEELEEIVTEGDHIYDSKEAQDSPVEKNKEMQDRIDVVNDDDDYMEEDTLSQPEEEAKVVPTKKPFFIKDPGKRLYYYAPV